MSEHKGDEMSRKALREFKHLQNRKKS